jgi:hypothetical protein
MIKSDVKQRYNTIRNILLIPKSQKIAFSKSSFIRIGAGAEKVIKKANVF